MTLLGLLASFVFNLSGEIHMQMLTILLMVILAGSPQRVQTEHPDRSKVIRVETALNHLTVIELADTVTLAAAGSPLFKIERRENKVFIQPLEEGVTTNLFVWTASGRWNYELVPAASVETMHFAIDQDVAPPPGQSSNTVTPPINDSPDFGIYQSVAQEMLLLSKPIRSVGVKFGRPNAVKAFVTDVYRKKDQLFIRYVIDNRSDRSYGNGQPEVFALESPRSQTSLYAIRYSQVGSDIERTIRSEHQTRMATLDCDVPSGAIPPGEAATGILSVQMASSSPEPTVLRLRFPSNGNMPIWLTLVL